MKSSSILKTVGLIAALAAVATGANAQVTDEWRVRAVLYGYVPGITGTTAFPTGNTGSIDVSPTTNLKFALMGLVEVRKGRWGGLVDAMYMNIGSSESQTRNLTVAGNPLPAGATANLDFDLKGFVVTLAGEYAAITGPGATLDIVAGARTIAVQNTLSWNFSVALPPGTGASRSGTSQVRADKWDGIVGVKGRFNFGADREWFVPYYLDIGTGQSDLTWQAVGGIGYAFK